MNSKHNVILRAIWICTFGLVIAAACSKETQDVTFNPLYIDPRTRDFSQNPMLLERILSGPHGYFRQINIEFSQEVCRRFKSSLAEATMLNLHGDAHIEQYVVTELGRGLTDYDDSSMGPAVIDWLRFGVSLQLACREQGWEENADELFDRFLLGYRGALKDTSVRAPEPRVVARMRSRFTTDRKKYFREIESYMMPIPKGERDSVLVAMGSYIETQLAEKPDLRRDYFDVVDMGRSGIGIGSALDLKYLLRVRGRTDDPLDDVVLECKQVRDLSEIECIEKGPKGDPFRILRGQARIAYQPFHHLGYFPFRKLNLWVHSWVENYEEIKIGETFQSVEEVAEVAYDIGVQLGKGHVKHVASPFDLQLCREQLYLLDEHETEVKQARRELAGLVVAAWRKFRTEQAKDRQP